ncbi:MAG: hypothetical protein HQK51_16475 [Oligoflexia bacterium]|nr:hypothetical protein [Oligoflexia bacterium]
MNAIDNEPIHLDQWVRINRFLVFYKFMAVISMLVTLLLFGHLIFTSMRPPIVIENQNDVHKFWSAKYENITMTKVDIENLVKNFILTRYQWNEFDIDKIVGGLKPWVNEGLLKQIRKDLQNQKVRDDSANTADGIDNNGNGNGNGNSGNRNAKNKDLAKSIKQRILIERVDVGDQAVIVDFDRVIEIGGIKVLASTQIAVEISEGEVTYRNPLGLYINGVIEHEKN